MSSAVPRALIALAIGAFGIGTTEFVVMGMLPEIADGATGCRRPPTRTPSPRSAAPPPDRPTTGVGARS
jgi:hypothetical protein